MFFRHTGQSFGRSALMLSGGANMGMFHFGVVKALREQNLLPRVISGSSAGSVVAAFLGTHKDSELDALIRGENMDLHVWRRLKPSEMLRQKSIMDIRELERFLRESLGETTFEEAFKRTRRIINITVSPVDRNQHSRLLNYLTTPHLLVWSAVLASCSVPGLFPPVKLMTKDRLGHEKPYMASIRWVDGAIESDLPAQRLGELYNVNHRIVSQTNPHVLPFISNQTRKEGWRLFLTDMVKGEVKYRSKQMMQLASYGIDRGIFKTLMEGTIAVIDQQYYGDVTIHPKVRLRDYQRVLGDLSKEEFQHWVLAGERATWPKIAMIRDQTIIGQTLEDCIIRLKKQRGRAMRATRASRPGPATRRRRCAAWPERAAALAQVACVADDAGSVEPTTQRQRKPCFSKRTPKKFKALGPLPPRSASLTLALADIRNGDHVFIGTGCAAPQTLLKALDALPVVPADLELLHFFTVNAFDRDTEGHITTRFRHRTFFVGTDMRGAVKQGLVSTCRCRSPGCRR
ncbi:MAG: patatin-like phospholipase family protein [Comamonadaceae bacterium]|nr:patatin-like phospholipase family protein [Comamonadaceae bacterium]